MKQSDKGLRLDVYRHVPDGDCTNGGVSGRCENLTLVGIVVPGPGSGATLKEVPKDSRVLAPSADAPGVWAVDRAGRNLPVCLVPANAAVAGDPRLLDAWCSRFMMGGNYARGDSRMKAITGSRAPIAIHDRREN